MCVAKEFPNIIYITKYFGCPLSLCRNVIATYSLISSHYLLLGLFYTHTKQTRDMLASFIKTFWPPVSFLFLFGLAFTKMSNNRRNNKYNETFFLKTKFSFLLLGLIELFFCCCHFYKLEVTWKHFLCTSLEVERVVSRTKRKWENVALLTVF